MVVAAVMAMVLTVLVVAFRPCTCASSRSRSILGGQNCRLVEKEAVRCIVTIGCNKQIADYADFFIICGGV